MAVPNPGVVLSAAADMFSVDSTSDSTVASLRQPTTDRRRSQRVLIGVPVSLIGMGKDQQFEEATETVVISERGCLVKLAKPLDRGASVRLTNPKTSQEALCKVVYIGQHAGGKTEIGLEFAQEHPNFWGVTFPPKDWNPQDRKLPSAGHPLK
jgi:PilZ domain